MDYKSIEELIQTVNQSGLYSFEVESDGTHIKMSKGPEQVLVAGSSSVQEPAVKLQNQETKAAEEVKSSEAAKVETPKEENLHVIKSPIVGTFYSAPSPEKPNYVNVGDKVKKGSVLCILEAMKLMNEIESEVSGKVISVLAENGQPVEYGEPRFLIDPLG